MTPDAWGHVAYVLLAIGHFGVARGLKFAWWVRFLGEFGWILIGIQIGMPSIWIWGTLFAVIDLYGAFRRDS